MWPPRKKTFLGSNFDHKGQSFDQSIFVEIITRKRSRRCLRFERWSKNLRPRISFQHTSTICWDWAPSCKTFWDFPCKTFWDFPCKTFWVFLCKTLWEFAKHLFYVFSLANQKLSCCKTLIQLLVKSRLSVGRGRKWKKGKTKLETDWTRVIGSQILQRCTFGNNMLYFASFLAVKSHDLASLWRGWEKCSLTVRELNRVWGH